MEWVPWRTEDNLLWLTEDAKPGNSEAELKVIEGQNIYQADCCRLSRVLCCPNDVKIPRIFGLFNELSMYQVEDPKRWYKT